MLSWANLGDLLVEMAGLLFAVLIAVGWTLWRHRYDPDVQRVPEPGPLPPMPPPQPEPHPPRPGPSDPGPHPPTPPGGGRA